MIFRPFVGEVITGRVKSCSSSGVRGKLNMDKKNWLLTVMVVYIVTLGFFDDIHIPVPALQPGSEL